MNSALVSKKPGGGQALLPFDIFTLSFAEAAGITSIATQKGIDHHPIRRSPRTLTFSVDTSQREESITKLRNAIRDHWRFCLSTGKAAPMIIHYNPDNSTYRGFISNHDRVLDKEASRTYNFTMPLIEGDSSPRISRVSRNSPFTPFNDAWYSTSSFNIFTGPNTADEEDWYTGDVLEQVIDWRQRARGTRGVFEV